jgi:membrane protein involved in colicin uptake
MSDDTGDAQRAAEEARKAADEAQRAADEARKAAEEAQRRAEGHRHPPGNGGGGHAPGAVIGGGEQPQFPTEDE